VASSVKSASYGLDSSGTPEVDLTPVDVAPKITSGTSTSFTAGRAGLFTVKATGYPIPSLSESGALPAGVRFTDNGDGTATLSGTPAIDAAGTYSITLTGSNGVAPDATRAFTLTVAPAMFTLSVKLSGTGTGTVVESSPQSPPTAGVINCPGKCSAKFPAGQQVVLQVDPASGSSLSTVSGCNQMSGDACTITLNANATVKATFATGGAAVATGPHPLAIRAQG
jgi:hypothetical protein